MSNRSNPNLDLIPNPWLCGMHPTPQTPAAAPIESQPLDAGAADLDDVWDLKSICHIHEIFRAPPRRFNFDRAAFELALIEPPPLSLRKAG